MAEGSVTHKNAISTWALLLLIRKWIISFESPAAQQRARCLFGALVGFAPREFRFDVRHRPHTSLVPSDSVAIAEVQVKAGKLVPLPALGAAWGSGGAHCGWPHSEVELTLAASGMSSASAAAEVFRGLASVIDLKVAASHSTSTEMLKRILDQQGSFYVDPHVKEFVHKLGRNSFRTSKFCKALRLRVAGDAHRAQVQERSKYWMATRKLMTGGITYATSVDATRFSGRDWQCGPICNVSEGKFAWMAPVVPHASLDI